MVFTQDLEEITSIRVSIKEEPPGNKPGSSGHTSLLERRVHAGRCLHEETCAQKPAARWPCLEVVQAAPRVCGRRQVVPIDKPRYVHLLTFGWDGGRLGRSHVKKAVQLDWVPLSPPHVHPSARSRGVCLKMLNWDHTMTTSCFCSVTREQKRVSFSLFLNLWKCMLHF